MSRAFVKEGDQEETPLVTPRASLPVGFVNYVTPNGLKELKDEHDLLMAERKTLKEQSDENNRVQINFITAKLQLLEDRINSAILVDPSNHPQRGIHFGATITLFKEEEDCECQYQIVGVDEADFSQNKVSFLSPIAKILINKKVGDKITLQTPTGKRFMKIEAVEYTA